MYIFYFLKRKNVEYLFIILYIIFFNFRNMKKCTDEEARSNIIVRSGMQYKICRDTYHMFYIIGTEDVYMRLPSSSSTEVSQSSSILSSSKWETWLESDKGWSKGLTDKNQAESDARKLLFSSK